MNQDNNLAVNEEESITSPLADNQGVNNDTEDKKESIPHLADDESQVESDNELYERPDYFPEQFWNEKDGPDLEGFAESYNHQRKLISQGKHKAPEGGEYNTEVLSEKGIDIDDPIAQTYMGWAKDHGISQAAFDDLADKVIETTGMVQEEKEELVASMKQELGPDADNIIRSNIEWADGLYRKGVLSADEREELDIMGGTPEAQRILVKLRGMQGDMAPIPTVTAPVGLESEQEFKTKMAAAMNDKRYGIDANYTRGVEQEFVKRYNRG